MFITRCCKIHKTNDCRNTLEVIDDDGHDDNVEYVTLLHILIQMIQILSPLTNEFYLVENWDEFECIWDPFESPYRTVHHQGVQSREIGELVKHTKNKKI